MRVWGSAHSARLAGTTGFGCSWALDHVRPHDEPGKWALQAREAVLKASDPARELEHQLREMACLDGMDLHPISEDEHAYGWFPYARKRTPGCPCRDRHHPAQPRRLLEFEEEPVVRPCVRTTLLPTDVIHR